MICHKSKWRLSSQQTNLEVIVKTIIMSLLLLISFNAFGLQGQYVKGALGFTLNGVGETTDNGSALGLEKDFPLPLIVAYGFDVDPTFSGEIEFSYRNNDYKTKTQVYQEAKAVAVMFNLVHRYRAFNLFDIVHGAGLGLAQYELTNDKELTVGMQLFTGAEYKVNHNVVVGTELRYHSNFLDFEVQGDDARYDQLAWLATGRFLF